jgi:hypothetical protein
MAEPVVPAGASDQHPLNPVLFSDRAGFPHESPADPPAVASPAPAAGTAAVSPVPSPRCAMWVTLDKGKPPELVHVPYIEVRDPDFVTGYSYGAVFYFLDGPREDDLHRPLTDQDLIKEVLHIFAEGREEAPPDGSSWQEWAAWTAGFLAGLISARLPSTLPLYGNCEACHQPLRACGHCPCCEPCTCPRPGSSQVAHSSE